ncbi:MAG: winged helix-turn-helix transcriptional regulator [Alkalinema sp. RU_4_3]|nr:winged helix-turn-helix transcriptional regulator [Alkalinema sp. RU_4_3]
MGHDSKSLVAFGRYGELRQQLPGVTERVLTMQLRELEQSGLVPQA